MNPIRPGQAVETPFKVDISNCDREPIHILGAVQSFGFLLALSADWQVVRASANVGDFLGKPAEALLGEPLSGLFMPEAIHALRNRLLLLHGADAVERLFALNLVGDSTRLFDIALHVVGGLVVIEAEPAQIEQHSVAGAIRTMIARLDLADGFEAFFREGARQVRALTGFDRVMVYRFDELGDGEVVAESVRSGIGSFLGLRYPASDVPVQARALYLRNLFRVIADVGAPTAAIVPALDATGQPLDLSLAVTRAVSPIHIEYLGNMGVAASLSISIIIDGKLWGLFVSHHYSPRLPSLERRSLAELFGQMFSTKLESRERQLMSDYLARARTVGDSLLAALAGNAALLEEPGWLGETIHRAIESDGVGVSVNGRIALTGLTPSEAEFAQIVRVLNSSALNRVYATNCIADRVPQAASRPELAAGMLAMPISRLPRDYVVLFRQEHVRIVRWAGDPKKPVEYGVSGPRLTPRKSFESWTELLRGRSKPFTAAELSVAEMLRNTLIEVVLRLAEDVNAERQLAAERQELLIAELNHRVRNILNLIRALVQRSRSGAVSIDDYVRETDSRIHALARAHDQITNDRWAPAPLRGLIQTEAEAYCGEKSTHLSLEGPEVLLTPLAFSTLALVIHELTTNSVKYGGLADSGRVIVRWQLGPERELLLHWREQGGPPVQPPRHQGFGSTIIRRSIPYDLGGKAELHYHLAGLEAHFTIPARHVSERATTAAETTPAVEPMVTVVSTGLLDDSKVLLVEDSLLIALDAEDCLLKLGASQVYSAANAPQALEEIERERPRLALLDIHLGDQTSFPVAERLKALGVPFLFTTGYGDRVRLPEALVGTPILQKPYTHEGIAKALANLLNGHGG